MHVDKKLEIAKFYNNFFCGIEKNEKFYTSGQLNVGQVL